MMKDENIQQKIETALNSLNGIRRAELSPYFYTRVEAALQPAPSPWENIVQALTRPAVAFAVFFSILVLNGGIVAWKSTPLSDTATETFAGDEFADDYSLAVTTFYDYENK